jgi:hypothetical protein
VYTLGIYYFMKKISLASFILVTGVLLSTSIVSAQSAGDLARGMGTFAGLVEVFTQGIVKSVATLLLSAALLAFFYGIVEYIWARRKGDAKGVSDGNVFITWSLIALFCMFSVYGIIRLGQNVLFDGKDVSTIPIPNFTFKPGNAGSVQIGQPDVCLNNGDTCRGGLGTCQNGACVTNGSQNNNAVQSNAHSAPVGDTAKKQNGYSCTTNSECQSGFCDPADDTCSVFGTSVSKANGYSCTTNSECQSGFCDPADDTCSTRPVYNSSASADCTVDSECNTGEICIAYKCVTGTGD